MRVRVECYAGHKADQRPLRFTLKERELQVEEVLDQWFSPEHIYFRVRADDGHIYILCHSENALDDAWTLESFRRVPRSG
ncbi:MAG: hypothetical protein HY656_05830 [Acidobacteria bacterium]|nr:hypothetical protein [Acidobacteriota bacterium]